ncbi:hypothetical protein BDC45DRAFT_501189 [Circinella umbellata]|nr:hypothetical protein BDC45DRAFT_501189 [Circinella umbellata]
MLYIHKPHIYYFCIINIYLCIMVFILLVAVLVGAARWCCRRPPWWVHCFPSRARPLLISIFVPAGGVRTYYTIAENRLCLLQRWGRYFSRSISSVGSGRLWFGSTHRDPFHVLFHGLWGPV